MNPKKLQKVIFLSYSVTTRYNFKSKINHLLEWGEN